MRKKRRNRRRVTDWMKQHDKTCSWKDVGTKTTLPSPISLAMARMIPVMLMATAIQGVVKVYEDEIMKKVAAKEETINKAVAKKKKSMEKRLAKRKRR